MENKKQLFLLIGGIVAALLICVVLVGLLGGFWPWQSGNDIDDSYTTDPQSSDTATTETTEADTTETTGTSETTESTTDGTGSSEDEVLPEDEDPQPEDGDSSSQEVEPLETDPPATTVPQTPSVDVDDGEDAPSGGVIDFDDLLIGKETEATDGQG